MKFNILKVDQDSKDLMKNHNTYFKAITPHYIQTHVTHRDLLVAKSQ